jgi:hypothetical protein
MKFEVEVGTLVCCVSETSYMATNSSRDGGIRDDRVHFPLVIVG